jgi:hypothetical protein
MWPHEKPEPSTRLLVATKRRIQITETIFGDRIVCYRPAGGKVATAVSGFIYKRVENYRTTHFLHLSSQGQPAVTMHAVSNNHNIDTFVSIHLTYVNSI